MNMATMNGPKHKWNITFMRKFHACKRMQIILTLLQIPTNVSYDGLNLCSLKFYLQMEGTGSFTDKYLHKYLFFLYSTISTGDP